MANAYMIRTDGKAIPVTIHPYANPDSVEETVAAAGWLYENTTSATTKQKCIQLFVAWALYEDPDISPAEYVPTLKYIVKHLPYKTISPEFIDNHAKEIEGARPAQLINLLFEINTLLNNEFLRVRIGGAYNSAQGNNNAYFRISSRGFNWFNIIWEFVYNRKNTLDTVTVIKDPESTGIDNQYYRAGGHTVDHMPVNDFIMLSGTPVFDSKFTRGKKITR